MSALSSDKSYPGSFYNSSPSLEQTLEWNIMIFGLLMSRATDPSVAGLWCCRNRVSGLWKFNPLNPASVYSFLIYLCN